ncbi:hypothetical protein AB0C21_35040 [Spirillospora sp. NPDC049024]
MTVNFEPMNASIPAAQWESMRSPWQMMQILVDRSANEGFPALKAGRAARDHNVTSGPAIKDEKASMG